MYKLNSNVLSYKQTCNRQGTIKRGDSVTSFLEAEEANVVCLVQSIQRFSIGFDASKTSDSNYIISISIVQEIINGKRANAIH